MTVYRAGNTEHTNGLGGKSAEFLKELGPFYTSAQNAAFETPHKTRGNANRTFNEGNI
jgi:hypothetical protein